MYLGETDVCIWLISNTCAVCLFYGHVNQREKSPFCLFTSVPPTLPFCVNGQITGDWWSHRSIIWTCRRTKTVFVFLSSSVYRSNLGENDLGLWSRCALTVASFIHFCCNKCQIRRTGWRGTTAEHGCLKHLDTPHVLFSSVWGRACAADTWKEGERQRKETGAGNLIHLVFIWASKITPRSAEIHPAANLHVEASVCCLACTSARLHVFSYNHIPTNAWAHV